MRVPVNSFEFQPCGRTPQVGYLLRLLRHRGGSIPPYTCIHRLQRGLPGYLILFAPHAFVPQRQFQSVSRLRHWCSSNIYAFHRYTFGIPLTSPALKIYSFLCSPGVEPRYFTYDLHTRLRTLYTSNSGQRLLPTYYRGCWHVVSRTSSAGTVIFFFPANKKFTIRRPSSFTRRCCVRGFPIAQYSPTLLPPVGVWAVSQSQCGSQPLSSPATDRRLGEPLPHQLSNQTRGHLSADCSL